MEELYEVRKKWHALGGLLKVDVGTLDAIGAQFRDIPDYCLREVLSHWLRQMNPLPCWNAIVDALHSPLMNEPSLAQALAVKHCPGMCISYKLYS